MKYIVKQSIQSQLEKDLNNNADNGYIWVCKLFAWNTTFGIGENKHSEKLITYLMSKI